MFKALSPVVIFLLFALSICFCYTIKLNSVHFYDADFGSFYHSTQFHQEGKNIYTKTFFVNTEKPASKPIQANSDLNPPFFVLLILPLGFLSYKAAFWCWSIFSMGCGIFSIFLLRKTFPEKISPYATLALLLAFFVYFPTFANIQYGQVSLVLLPLLIGAWICERTQKFFLSGILLGVLASLKIFFGLFIVYFLFRRAWRQAFFFTITFVLCTLIPLPFFGIQSYFHYYANLHEIHWYAANWNASILGFLTRLLGGENNIALINIPHLTQKLFFLLSGLLLIGLIKFYCSKIKTDPIKKCDLDFSVTLVVMLLLSPLGWLYYFVFLIIPFVVIIQSIESQRHVLALRGLTALALGLSGIRHSYLSSGHITQTNVVSVFALSSGYVAVLVILLGILFFLRHSLYYAGHKRSIFCDPLLTYNAIRCAAVLENQAFLSQPSETLKRLLNSRATSIDDTQLLTYSVALLPSLFSILTVINNSALFGQYFVPAFNTYYFGS